MIKPTLYFTEEGRAAFAGLTFNDLMSLQGKAFRDVKGRKTIQINREGQSFFVKQHFGVGWLEIFKNWLTFRKPVIGAITEKVAIEKLDEIGISTTPLVAFGECGINPARKQSFLITRDLGNIVSLEDLCQGWIKNPPDDGLKKQLIVAVATLAKKLHENGMAHRDFYICHFCLDADLLVSGQIEIYLIDLHRMLTKQKLGGKSVMKDIAALYFSALDIGLQQEDLDLFKHYYCQNLPINFWKKVQQRANKLYAKFNSVKFQRRLNAEKSVL
jgi:heptose I phosphotransferase